MKWVVCNPTRRFPRLEQLRLHTTKYHYRTRAISQLIEHLLQGVSGVVHCFPTHVIGIDFTTARFRNSSVSAIRISTDSRGFEYLVSLATFRSNSKQTVLS